MIARDLMASIREMDRVAQHRADLGAMIPTAQYHRHLLLAEIDRLTKELDHAQAELAAAKVVTVHV